MRREFVAAPLALLTRPTFAAQVSAQSVPDWISVCAIFSVHALWQRKGGNHAPRQLSRTTSCYAPIRPLQHLFRQGQAESHHRSCKFRGQPKAVQLTQRPVGKAHLRRIATRTGPRMGQSPITESALRRSTPTQTQILIALQRRRQHRLQKPTLDQSRKNTFPLSCQMAVR